LARFSRLGTWVRSGYKGKKRKGRCPFRSSYAVFLALEGVPVACEKRFRGREGGRLFFTGTDDEIRAEYQGDAREGRCRGGRTKGRDGGQELEKRGAERESGTGGGEIFNAYLHGGQREGESK